MRGLCFTKKKQRGLPFTEKMWRPYRSDMKSNVGGVLEYRNAEKAAHFF
jgi:hypothetical protein